MTLVFVPLLSLAMFALLHIVMWTQDLIDWLYLPILLQLVEYKEMNEVQYSKDEDSTYTEDNWDEYTGDLLDYWRALNKQPTPQEKEEATALMLLTASSAKDTFQRKIQNDEYHLNKHLDIIGVPKWKSTG
jgi:hypothetical protein